MNNVTKAAGTHTLANIVSILGLHISGPSVNTTRGVGASNDAVIDLGSRNDTLASLAGTMRARSMSHEAIEAALLATNLQQCNPPLPDDEVRGIARSIANYAPGTPNAGLRTLTG